jgi:MYXO-CTERM domain-containing protein
MKPNLDIPENRKPKPGLLWLVLMAMLALLALRSERRR